VPVDAIAEKLMVSPSTVSRLRTGVEAGKFATTIKAARKNKVEEAVATILKTIILGPRQRTEPRWKWLEEF
jgi:transcriptional regulator with XRE-family HTH domain